MNNNKNELPIEIKNNLWNKIKNKLEKIFYIKFVKLLDHSDYALRSDS